LLATLLERNKEDKRRNREKEIERGRKKEGKHRTIRRKQA
jgi:hypothetical protein